MAMRRVLVPLDGTPLATSILPDARRFAGAHGELILIHDATSGAYFGDSARRGQVSLMYAARDYLRRVAAELERDGFKVRTQVLVVGSPAAAIENAVTTFEPDMIACATHGRGPIRRLWWGSVAWTALTHSSVPVLLRHPERGHPDGERSVTREQRRIMVPLDGSDLAAQALPLAGELAREWGAAIWLVRAVPECTIAPTGYMDPVQFVPHDVEAERRAAESYLDEVASSVPGEVHLHVYVGPAVDTLARAVRDWSISDVIMASHGRSGLPRVILGSVADELIQHLYVPILVIPALAVRAVEAHRKGAQDLVSAGA